MLNIRFLYVNGGYILFVCGLNMFGKKADGVLELYYNRQTLVGI